MSTPPPVAKKESAREPTGAAFRLEKKGSSRFVCGEVVAASSFPELDGALSADGRRLAFGSAQSTDAMQIWVAGADGSEPQQLTRGGRMRGSPSWSPDARQLAFDSYDEDSRYHIWIMDADGANQRQLTADPGDQNIPTWSRDGQWIYFSWGQGNERDLWRMHPAGGLKERVTRGGSGHRGEESADGTHVLYQPQETDGPLLSVPVNGGAPRQLVACVSQLSFAVAATGIYYVPCFRDTPDPALHLMDLNTGSDRVLGTLEHFGGYLTVSRDGQIILYGRGTAASDLMLIENFR